MIKIYFLLPGDLIVDKDGLISAYFAAYAAPPYNEPFTVAQEFGKDVLKNGQHQGFRCVIARQVPEDGIIGFAYGYTSLPGEWWHDTVTRGLGDEIVEEWFSNAFEFIEFGGIPPYRGQGIGSQLHQKLLSDLNLRTAVLKVMQADIPAFRMYHDRGWIALRKDFKYHEGDHPCTIMGLDLAKYKSSVNSAD